MKTHFFQFVFAVLFFAACNLEKIEDMQGGCTSKPVAAFAITNSGCVAPCQVVFTNESTDATGFEWDFGDGTPKVTEGNPTHTYETPGDYIVTMKAFCGTIEDVETKTTKVNAVTFIKNFGSTSNVFGKSVRQTQNGYIIAGTQLIKTDNVGTHVWTQNFWVDGGGTSTANSVQQTQDGGYIIAGSSIFQNNSSVYLGKTNDFGINDWNKTFGGSNDDIGECVQKTQDGGYIVGGTTFSEGAGNADFYLIKVNSEGNLSWKKTFGGSNWDKSKELQQTADGGYIIVGYTDSKGSGEYDVYLIKTDNLGALVWEQTYGGALNEYGFSVAQTPDGGYILTGATKSKGNGEYDVYLIKTNNVGMVDWEKTFGGAFDDEGKSIRQTSDGGYIIVGYTTSEGAGGTDVYLIKTDNNGVLAWKRTFGGAFDDFGESVQQTNDGGFIITGSTSDALGNRSVYLIKTDKDGNVQ